MVAELFGTKYRIPSARLVNWDYASDGFYHVTICTRARREYFGKIKNGKMNLSPIGMAADQCWRDIPAHFPHVELDEFVIMPNHVHGVLRIMGGRGVLRDRRDANIRVSTNVGNDVRPRGGATGVANPMGKNTLGEMIRWFKGKCSFVIHATSPDFAWQSRFYEHVIRDQNDLERIRHYIRANPEQWDRDRNNFENELKIL